MLKVKRKVSKELYSLGDTGHTNEQDIHQLYNFGCISTHEQKKYKKSKQERMVDALAQGGDEGRDKLR